MDYVIEAKNLGKRYRIGRSSHTLRDAIWSPKAKESDQFHWAAQGVNFALRQGEAMGIIGPNGAGKTTILKLLAQITKPTAGSLTVNGRFSALIELGAGFHPDLSGRENIFLNASILGMSRKGIARRFDEIVDFAGIEKFIDTPVKRYSSGMYARLGFAIAAHIDPQVMLIDEVLAVGDYAFQQKCHMRMDKLRENGTTLIFISHNLDAVRRVCDLGLVMYQGQPIYQGSAEEAIVAYSDAVRQAARESNRDVPKEKGLSQRVMTFDAEIERVQLCNTDGLPTSVLQSGSKATIQMTILAHKRVENPVFAIGIRTAEGHQVYGMTTQWLGIETPILEAGERCCLSFNLDVPLLNGEYLIGANLGPPSLTHYFDVIEQAQSFLVVKDGITQGFVDMNASVEYEVKAAI